MGGFCDHREGPEETYVTFSQLPIQQAYLQRFSLAFPHPTMVFPYNFLSTCPTQGGWMSPCQSGNTGFTLLECPLRVDAFSLPYPTDVNRRTRTATTMTVKRLIPDVP